MRYLYIHILFLIISLPVLAQEELLEKKDEDQKEYITSAFKSSRVINGHSMELIGKGIMDVRILHRFGLVNSGIEDLWGLDDANMRIGFDYGISKNFTAGIGRSNVAKEWDGFLKFRPVCQSKGGKRSWPVSIVLVTGATVTTVPWTDTSRKYYFTNRMGFYSEIIIGRKFNDRFSLQLSPIFVHRNIVPLATDENNTYALGIGSRFKISKRIAFVVDYHLVIAGLNMDIYNNPLSIGVDIETGGHVFQLHFSNSTGMNEKAFITGTTDSWGKGEVRFGFNLSRVFNVSGNK